MLVLMFLVSANSDDAFGNVRKTSTVMLRACSLWMGLKEVGDILYAWYVEKRTVIHAITRVSIHG